jgi:signal transduction histidine kinase
MVKHAKAYHGHVDIKREGAMIRIKVEDDGEGFNPPAARAEVEKKNCFGLFNIRERLGHFGGNMEIDSSPGSGSRFILTAPLMLQ